jgi:hypothetical protein
LRHPLFDNSLICNDEDLPWGIGVANKVRAIFEACYRKHKDLWDLENNYWKNF